MKAWEIIKALEEGKKVRSLDGIDEGKEYIIEEIGGGEALHYILACPSHYEVVKENIKIKLYRYTHYYYDDIDWYEVSNWISVPHEVAFDQNIYKLIKTEEKEIEVDDE